MESKSFDKIIKENLEEILLPLAKKLLGFEIVHSKPMGELELQKYVRQLNILSRLRKLQDITIKTINTMPITYDIQKDELFLKGIEQGLEQGIEQGLEQGMAKGMEKEKVNLIKNLLALGSLTINQIALVTETTEEFVLAIQEELQSKEEEE